MTLSAEWKTNVFEADSKGRPKRKLYIWQDPPREADDAPNVVSGWGFSVSKFDEADQEQPLWDTWEATFEEILRYSPQYAPRDITWRRAGGEVVDLYKLKN